MFRVGTSLSVPLTRTLASRLLGTTRKVCADRKLAVYLFSRKDSLRFLSTNADVPSEEQAKEGTGNGKEQRQILKQQFDEDGYYEETEGNGSQVRYDVYEMNELVLSMCYVGNCVSTSFSRPWFLCSCSVLPLAF